MSVVQEANFDGLVGPTHNYSGLSFGNRASMQQGAQQAVSNPRAAALQGLAKMQLLVERGLLQGVLAPHERPHIPFLLSLGFRGADEDLPAVALKSEPELLTAASAASAMWTANAATVSPSVDCADRRLHFSPANLSGNLHRSLEAPQTTRALRRIFSDSRHFCVHDPLPGSLADEGAANFMRLARTHAEVGLEIMVHGRHAGEVQHAGFPARQTLEASRAVLRRHGVRRELHLRQSRRAIQAGVFHNDVIAVANADFLLMHAQAFEDRTALDASGDWRIRVVGTDELSLEDSVQSYLFNSQILNLPEANGAGVLFLAPTDCEAHDGCRRVLDSLVSDGHVSEVCFVNLRESMRNGGGPACLRLRVTLTEAQRAALPPDTMLDPARLGQLRAWVGRHYRDRLTRADLADPGLVREGRVALDELTRILGLGGDFYSFQRAGG